MTRRSHVIASAIAMCPSKPNDVASAVAVAIVAPRTPRRSVNRPGVVPGSGTRHPRRRGRPATNRYAHKLRPSAPEKPSATTAASSINASRVSRFSCSRSISAPVSR
jgi:hypothetical protein